MFSALLSLAPFAAILAFFYIFLTIHVVQMRRRARVALGTGRHEALTRAIRAHGNFAEYVPFCLVMLSLSALLGASSLLIIIGGLLLVVGRIAHSYSILLHEAARMQFRWRTIGTISTFLVLIITSVFLLSQWLQHAL